MDKQLPPKTLVPGKVEDIPVKSTEEQAVREGQGGERKIRVLVVDDTPTVSNLVKNALTRDWVLSNYGIESKFDVVIAEDGMEGWEKFQAAESSEIPFDLVITDYNMPELNGPGLVKKIRSTEPSPKILMFTSEATADYEKIKEEFCRKHGVDGCLPKPVNMNVFFDVLKNVLPSLRQKDVN